MDDLFEFEENGFNLPEPDPAAIDGLVRAVRPRLMRRLERIRRPRARGATINTALGRLLVAESDRGLLAVRFLGAEDEAALMHALRQKFDVVEDEDFARRIAAEIDGLMHGHAGPIMRRRIDLSLVESAFQRRTLNRLRQVPAGSVVSYRALAAAVGAPNGQRAVGNTVASNPLPIYVPCHRVIRSDGAIGNYGGGVERKLKLLRAEGFAVGADRRVPQDAVYGHWTSRIFCRPNCSAVRRAERRKWIIFSDSAKARGAGLRPCKLCQPAGR